MSRTRLTITLKQDILKLVDETVDGETIRNRSHAIEHILSQGLLKPATKTLVLAGGKGIVFPGMSSEVPKAMSVIAGKPLLEHTIARLRVNGFTNIVVSVGASDQKIKDYFRNGSRFGVKISYIDQLPGKRGTAQPLREARQLFLQGPFLLVYGDVLTDINFKDLLDFHNSQAGIMGTMALTSVEDVGMWGVARLMGSKIIEFEEKPKNPRTHSHLVNAGVYVLEPEIFNYITADIKKLESGVFPRLAEENKLGGYAFDTLWCDISSPESCKQAIARLGNRNL